jgi:myosin heavy chain kinase D
MKTKKIIIVMILFALIFAKSEDLSKITNAMTRTEAMAKTKMPRFNSKLLKKEKKNRRRLIKKYKLDKATVKKVDKWVKNKILRTRRFIEFLEGLYELNIIDENGKLIKKPRFIANNEPGNDTTDVADNNTENNSNNQSQNPDNKTNNSNNNNKNNKTFTKPKQYIVTKVPAGMYTAPSHPHNGYRQYSGSGMRPDGKIYDVELYNFGSNISYAVISRKHGNKIISKSYMIDLMTNTMTPMNYGKINRINSSYADGGNYMKSDSKALRYYIDVTINGVTSNITVEFQDSWEYVIRGVENKKNVKADSENYTDEETEKRNAESVFNTGMAITVKKTDKIRNDGVIVKQITVIGRDNKSKPTNLSKFNNYIDNGKSQYIMLYIFPDEEIFFTNYDEAVNHMIENYENGKTGSFVENYLVMSHCVYTWPDNESDGEMLRNLGYFPKTMTVAYNTD